MPKAEGKFISQYGRYIVYEVSTSDGLRYRIDGPGCNGVNRYRELSFKSKSEARSVAKQLEKDKEREKIALKQIREMSKNIGAPNIQLVLEMLIQEGLRGKDLYELVMRGLREIKFSKFNLSQGMELFFGSLKDKKTKKVITSDKHVSTIERRTTRFLNDYGDLPLYEITPELVEEWLKRQRMIVGGGPLSPQEHNKLVEEIGQAFRWFKRRGITKENPFESIVKYNLDAPALKIELPSVEKIMELLRFLETYTGSRPNAPKKPGFLVPHFVVKIFSPIRPHGELSRLDVDQMFLVPGEIDIDEYTSKTNTYRIAPYRPNFEAWNKAFPITNESLRPRDLTREISIINEKFGIDSNILRKLHLNHVKLEGRTINQVAKQAGNSPEVLKRFYLMRNLDVLTKLIFDIFPSDSKESEQAA